MVRKTIYLTKSQSEALEQRAREQGVSFSEMVRRSVDQYLKQQVTDEVRQRAINAVGYASSGVTDEELCERAKQAVGFIKDNPDLSMNHDSYLADVYLNVGQ